MEWDGKTRNNSELKFVIETPLRTTVVVDTQAKCEEAIQQIITDCSEYRAVGFDCEWIGQRILQKYGKVLIVSICSPKGYCALFRLNKLRRPKCLIDFLEDDTLKKAGVGGTFSVTHLWTDYQIQVKGYVELREKAMFCKEELEHRLGSRLQHIAQHLYFIYVHRDLTDFDATKFVALELSEESIAFAVQDVHSFIETYKHFFPSIKET